MYFISTGRTSLLVLCMLIHVSCEDRTILVSTGQGFVDALRTMVTDDNLLIRISDEQGILNTSSVVLKPPAASQITNGTFTITAARPGMFPFIDLWARANVMQTVTGAARGFAYNLTMCGFCAYPLTIREMPNEGLLQGLSAVFFGLTPYSLDTLTGRRLSHRGLTAVTSVAEMALYVYAHMLLDLAGPIPKFKAFSDRYINVWLVINTQAVVYEVTPYSITFQQVIFPSIFAENFTITSTSNPIDPRYVDCSPLRMCADANGGGRLLLASEQAVNSSISPYWHAQSDAELQHAMQQAAGQLAMKNHSDWPAMVFLMKNVSMAAAAAGVGPFVLPGYTIITGPFNHVPATYVTVVLDFQNMSAPLLHLPDSVTNTSQDYPVAMVGASFLAINKLTLTGLVAAPLGSWPSLGLASTDYISAMPLWAISRGINSSQSNGVQLRLNQVILIVPQADFKALLAAALRGQAWQTGARTTRPLMSGITSFEPARSDAQQGGVLSAASHSLLLEQYSGFGVEATKLWLVPDQALQPCTELPDMDSALMHAECGPDSHGGVSRGLRLGLGLGLGLGGGLLLMGLAVIGCAVFQDRTRSRAEQRATKADGASSVALTVGDLQPNGVQGFHKVSDTGAGTGSSKQLSTGLPPSSGGHGLTNMSVGSSSSPPSAYNVIQSQLGFSDAVSRIAAQRHPSKRLNVHDDAASQAALHQSPAPPLSNDGIKASVRLVADALNTEQADRLALTGVLGTGTFGKVYSGIWRGMHVAVKTVVFSSAQEEAAAAAGVATDTNTAYQRAVTEAAVAVAVSHPNVVSTYRYDFKVMADVVEEGQQLEINIDKAADTQSRDFKLYLIQELCDTSLADAVVGGALSYSGERRARHDVLTLLLLDIVSGVEYLHSRNVIHGDLKPDNVLLKLDQTCPLGVVAKLTDFGLAVAVDPTASHVSNYRVGTVFFMAPEVIADARLTRASDIYSLGVMIWSLFTGANPWLAQADGTFMRNPAFPSLPSEMDVSTPIAQALLTIMHRCLSEVPTSRPTATEILEALKAMLPLCSWPGGVPPNTGYAGDAA